MTDRIQITTPYREIPATIASVEAALRGVPEDEAWAADWEGGTIVERDGRDYVVSVVSYDSGEYLEDSYHGSPREAARAFVKLARRRFARRPESEPERHIPPGIGATTMATRKRKSTSTSTKPAKKNKGGGKVKGEDGRGVVETCNDLIVANFKAKLTDDELTKEFKSNFPDREPQPWGRLRGWYNAGKFGLGEAGVKITDPKNRAVGYDADGNPVKRKPSGFAAKKKTTSPAAKKTTTKKKGTRRRRPAKSAG